MPHPRFLVLLTVAMAVPATADIQLQVQSGKIDLQARAPLSEILDRVARQTGMKVVYEGAPPRSMVVADYKGLTPARLVLSLLEGQNLAYAVVTDPTGRDVTTLMFPSASASSGTARSTPAMPTAPAMSTGYDPSDAAIAAGDFGEPAYDESVPEPEAFPEAVPEPVPVPEGAPPAVEKDGPAPMTSWPGGPAIPQFQGGQPSIVNPFPQRDAQQQQEEVPEQAGPVPEDDPSKLVPPPW